MLRVSCVIGLLSVFSGASGAGLHAQTQPVSMVPPVPYRTVHPASDSQRNATSGEAFAEQRFRAARATGALSLHAFLEEMPKGADLHMHLAGAVYAETLIKDAADDNLCVDPAHETLVKSEGLKQDSEGSPAQPICAPGQVPAATALTDQKMYDALIDSFSMRAFVPSASLDGHDQFFASFSRFGAVKKTHAGEWLDEVATRAASQNVQYLEVMQTPIFTHAAKLGYALGWPVKSTPVSSAASSAEPISLGTSRDELADLRSKLINAGLRDEVATDHKEFAEALAERERIERCGTPAAASACAVQVRFLYQVLRAFPPQQVFAQTLLAFEVATSDPDVVGINFVQPEDAYRSMAEYHRQMLMLDYLHSVYPAVHISLHAGELAPGMVPPAGLSFHIREAIELGHAERIGHGVDVMYETQPENLLREMAARHVMVEINLTSNDVILGVGPNHHSLPEYRAAGVPVALSTDDEGVARIDLTHEYVRAATDFHLEYGDLKRMARTSLQHAFLPGASLWAADDDFSRRSAPCAGSDPRMAGLSKGCAEFLRSSERATQQWELERRFDAFETASKRPRRSRQ